jgi:hypothetical protein
LRTDSFRFYALGRTCPVSTILRAGGLASLAPLGLVLEALIGEKHLFAGGEDKLPSALTALQDPIVIFHMLLPHQGRTGQAAV